MDLILLEDEDKITRVRLYKERTMKSPATYNKVTRNLFFFKALHKKLFIEREICLTGQRNSLYELPNRIYSSVSR